MIETKKVAILGGTGNLGHGMAIRLAGAGHTVVIGSRDVARAQEAAQRISTLISSPNVSGAHNVDAVDGADFVLVAVPFASQASTLVSVKNSLQEGQIVIDACVPLGTALGGKPTQLTGVWHGSAAQQAAALVPKGVHVVSGLHTLSADDLANPEIILKQDTLVCGDSKADKKEVTALLSTIEGLRVIDAGRLEISRMVEGITPILIGINIRYKVHSGFQITGIS